MLWMQCYEYTDVNVYDASMNARTTKINWLGDKTGSLGNKLIGITGKKRLSITFKMVAVKDA